MEKGFRPLSYSKILTISHPLLKIISAQSKRPFQSLAISTIYTYCAIFAISTPFATCAVFAIYATYTICASFASSTISTIYAIYTTSTTYTTSTPCTIYAIYTIYQWFRILYWLFLCAVFCMPTIIIFIYPIAVYFFHNFDLRLPTGWTTTK